MVRFLFAGAVLLLPSCCWAQQATYATPLTSTNDSFFESFGVNWGFERSTPRGGAFFRFGTPNGAIAPFGGFTSQAGGRLGFGIRGAGGSSFFNFSAAQGSQRSVTSTTPSVTMMNGTLGSIQNATVRPFVTGVTPVVRGRVTSPVLERLERLKYEQPGRQPNQTKRRSPQPRIYPSRRARPRSTAETTDISVAEIRAAR